MWYNYPVKICTKCFIEKPEADFFIKDKQSGRLHAQCKACYKAHRVSYYSAHYSKYHAEYLNRAKARREMLRNEFRRNMLEYLKKQACTICGESDIRVLEFDHLNPSEKSFNVSQAVRLGIKWSEVLLELEKCRVLCANCHKRHTASQAGWYKDI